MYRAAHLFTFLTLAVAGCSSASDVQREARLLAHGDIVDGGPETMRDASRVGHDAYVPGTDAWVAPRPDAWVAGRDAWTAPVDAATVSCPTYNGDVRPIYAMHCANCHTTGSDPRFGSSYSVATSSTSSCRTSMAVCTLELGRPGGSMARRDALGGFDTTEQATIQAWIDCGMPN